jgi:hypothetical protein
VRSGGERARVDSGGLLWYGAKLCAMVASLMQAESVGIGSSAERGSVWEGIQESVHESLFVGIVHLGASTAPSPLLVCRTSARAFSVLVLKPTAPSSFFTKSLHSACPYQNAQ